MSKIRLWKFFLNNFPLSRSVSTLKIDIFLFLFIWSFYQTSCYSFSSCIFHGYSCYWKPEIEYNRGEVCYCWLITSVNCSFCRTTYAYKWQHWPDELRATDPGCKKNRSCIFYVCAPQSKLSLPNRLLWKGQRERWRQTPFQRFGIIYNWNIIAIDADIRIIVGSSSLLSLVFIIKLNWYCFFFTRNAGKL